MELALIGDGRIGRRVSSPLGPFRLQQIEGGAKERRRHVERVLRQLKKELHVRHEKLYLVGGSWRAIARLDMERSDYPLKVLHEYRMTPDSLRETLAWIERSDPSALRQHTGTSSERMELVPLAAEVLAQLVDIFHPREIDVSSYGIREGLLYEHMPQRLRARDPLIESCRFSEAASARIPGFGKKLYGFLLPLYKGASPERLRLVKAACLLHDVTWRAHPDYRAEACFDNATRANLGGLDHPGRVFLGLALLHRYKNSRGGSRLEPVFRLLDDDAIRDAEVLGKAMRFGAMFSIGDPSEAGELRHQRRKGVLELVLQPKGVTLFGEVAQARFASLASALKVTTKITVARKSRKGGHGSRPPAARRVGDRGRAGAAPPARRRQAGHRAGVAPARGTRELPDLHCTSIDGRRSGEPIRAPSRWQRFRQRKSSSDSENQRRVSGRAGAADLFPCGIDRDQPAFGQLDRLDRDTAGNHAVGVAFANRTVPCGADLVEGRVMRHAEDGIGIAGRVGHETCAHGMEATAVESEDLRHPTQEMIFVRMVGAVGHGDMEKALEQIGQHAVILVEHSPDPPGVKLEPRHILTREIEDPRGIGLFLRRDPEDVAEGGNLVAGDLAVGLGHFRAQCDHRDGEGDGTFRRLPAAFEQRRKPLAVGEGRQGFGDAAPDRHAGQHNPARRRCQRVNRGFSASARDPASGRTCTRPREARRSRHSPARHERRARRDCPR